MTKKSKFEVGQTYYYWNFHDDDCKIPSIEAYKYIGKNVKEVIYLDVDDPMDVYFFQDIYTYMLNGSLAKYSGQCKTGIIPDFNLDNWYDAKALIKKLTSFKKKFKEQKELTPGKVFYFIEYHDMELTIPIFNTYIYIGQTTDENGEELYQFFEPETFISKGIPEKLERWEVDTESDKKSLYRFYDFTGLIELLNSLPK